MTTDIERRLAELCGIKLNVCSNGDLLRIEEIKGFPHHSIEFWHPLTSIEQAMMCEGKIPGGIQAEYIHHLCILTEAYENPDDLHCVDWFLVIHANSEQRCRAAIAALESAHD